MIKKVSLLLLVAALSTSCVSKKVYNELEGKYAALKKQQRELSDENHGLEKAKNQLENDLKLNQDELAKVKAERDKLRTDYEAASNNLKTLQASYAALEKNSDEALQANMKKNRELLAQLDAKEKALKRMIRQQSEQQSKQSKQTVQLFSVLALPVEEANVFFYTAGTGIPKSLFRQSFYHSPFLGFLTPPPRFL